MKKIIILGSTGSIGRQTLDIIKKDKNKFKVLLLSTDKNINLISKQIKNFKVENIVVTNKKKYEILKKEDDISDLTNFKEQKYLVNQYESLSPNSNKMIAKKIFEIVIK